MCATTDIIEHVSKSCAARGKLLTAKRKLLLQALSHAQKALSAYELVDYCQQHFSETVQVMTVYRALQFLEHEHFAHKLNGSNKYIICAHILCDHEHGIAQFLICSKCNKITEQIIEPRIIAGLQLHAQQTGFTVSEPQLEINGVCHECV